MTNDKHADERRLEAERTQAQSRQTNRPPPADLGQRLIKHAQELRTHADGIEALVGRMGISRADILGLVRDLRVATAGILTVTGGLVEVAEEIGT